MKKSEQRQLHCICCPLGCRLTVTTSKDNVISVMGNTCPRGEAYGRQEVTDPQRILTTTVRITGGALPLLPVVSQTTLPKGKILACAQALRRITVTAPVHMGDVIVANILDTGAAIVASRDIEENPKA